MIELFILYHSQQHQRLNVDEQSYLHKAKGKYKIAFEQVSFQHKLPLRWPLHYSRFIQRDWFCPTG